MFTLRFGGTVSGRIRFRRSGGARQRHVVVGYCRRNLQALGLIRIATGVCVCARRDVESMRYA